MSKRGYDHLFKLLIIGDSAVGKSSLLIRYSDNEYTQSYVSTIGVDFKIKTVKIGDEVIKLSIWDTAGQERFLSIQVSYYRGAMGIVLVYDITNKHSFDNISKWLHNIEQYGKSNVEKILLGNKCDEQDLRRITESQGIEFAKRYDITFLETSAKLDINVEKAFMHIATAILKKKPRSESFSDSYHQFNLKESRDKTHCTC